MVDLVTKAFASVAITPTSTTLSRLEILTPAMPSKTDMVR